MKKIHNNSIYLKNDDNINQVDIITKYNFGTKCNDIMEFLILLREEDIIETGCIFKTSTKKKILKKEKYLPGNLTIFNFDSIDTLDDYIINDSPVPNEMYIKLHTTNTYYLSEKYTLKYLLAKENELKKIFIMLGAKKIKWHIKKSANTSNSIGINASINMNQIDLVEGFDMNLSCSIINYESNEMKFGYNKNILQLNNNSFNTNLFYFLPKEYDWQQIIIRRLEQKLLNDEFIELANNSKSRPHFLFKKL